VSGHDDVALTSEERLKLALMEEHDYIETVMRDVARDHEEKQ
jgi:hypothetical protein